MSDKKVGYPSDRSSGPVIIGSTTLARDPIYIFEQIKRAEIRDKFEVLLDRLRKNLPTGFKMGAALGAGNCFFDSIAQGLNELKRKGSITSSRDFNVKLLREDCANDASKYKDKIIKDAEDYFVPQKNVAFPDLGNIKDERGNDVADGQKTFDRYLGDIKKTAEEDERSIWGRPEVEGKVISNKYDVDLYFYSINEGYGQKFTVTKITPAAG